CSTLMEGRLAPLSPRPLCKTSPGGLRERHKGSGVDATFPIFFELDGVVWLCEGLEGMETEGRGVSTRGTFLDGGGEEMGGETSVEGFVP
ncbi:hypothetical protein KI387_028197, partial [Taxus chinensis]